MHLQACVRDEGVLHGRHGCLHEVQLPCYGIWQRSVTRHLVDWLGKPDTLWCGRCMYIRRSSSAHTWPVACQPAPSTTVLWRVISSACTPYTLHTWWRCSCYSVFRLTCAWFCLPAVLAGLCGWHGQATLAERWCAWVTLSPGTSQCLLALCLKLSTQLGICLCVESVCWAACILVQFCNQTDVRFMHPPVARSSILMSSFSLQRGSSILEPV